MKKLLIYILIVGIIFICGCIDNGTDGGKTDSKTSTDFQSSEPLIEPSDLPRGYYSSGYATCAISHGESFEIRPNFDIWHYSFDKLEYEGDIPPRKKRIATFFQLNNDDNSIQMRVIILESDSSSRLEEYISELESDAIKNGIIVETNLVGDYSVLQCNSVLTFTYKNYVVLILAYPTESDIIRKETLKVAKAIESRLD